MTFENGNLVIDSGNTATQNYQFFGQGYNSDGSPMKGGVWEDNSQTSLLWMLKLGYYDSDEMKEAAEELLVENIRNENPDESSIRADYGENTLAAGFLGANVITPVLSDNGHADVAYDLLLQDEQPSWLYEVEAGATTVWERWNSYTEGVGFGDAEMNSFNHYAYGAVVEWMYRYMAGITADEENPGFKHIILQPALDTGAAYNDQARINSVEGTYDSYLGTITSAWTSQGEGENAELVTYHTVIPANTTATLYLPVDESAIEGFEAVEGVSGVEAAEHNGQMTVKLELESGGYDFTVQDGRLTVAYAEGYTAAAIRKAHPAVRIPPFSVLIQSALPPIISTTIRKTKTELFRLRLTVCPVSAFQTGNASIFKHQHRAQFLYQPIKFCLLFFLSEFGIVSGKAQPGSPGMVMESRKAAPALRARPLRSYVPLRRDPSESVLSGTIPGLPGGFFSTHKFKFHTFSLFSSSISS